MPQFLAKTAIARIRRARSYTKNLIADIAPDEWFWRPEPIVTHIAWQIGHLAKAQYDHCLEWIRGRSEADQSLISDQFLELFKMGSNPLPGRDSYPSTGEIQHVFDRVHEQVLTELSVRTDEELKVPIDLSRPNRTKLGGLFWNSEHEFLHAGQIGLLRRLMGKPPLR
jgi:hypothetical protein